MEELLMRKMFSLVCLCLFLLAFVTTTVDVFAQDGDAAPATPAAPQVAAPEAAAGIDGKSLIKAFALLGAGIAMGFGAIGPGIGEGFAAGKACEGMAKRPDQAGLLTRSMLIGQAADRAQGAAWNDGNSSIWYGPCVVAGRWFGRT